MTLQELMEKRASIIAQARQIHEAAKAENREMTEEEEQNFNKTMDDAAALMEKIEREQKLATLETDLGQSAGEPAHTSQDPVRDGEGGASQRAVELRSLFPSLTDEQIEAEEQREAAFPRTLPAFLLKDYRGLSNVEHRALQQDLDVSGGYLLPPIKFVQDLIQAVDNLVYVRQWATKYQVTDAHGLGAPSLDADPADPTWTSELLIGAEDSTMTFGDRELNPNPLAQYIKISRKLIRSVANAQALVQERLAYKQSVVQENAFLNGSGANEPLGVFTASANGISTSRDVSTGNTTTSIQFDGLIEAKYTLKPQYWPRARWVFHRDGQKQIAKLKDGEGQYIWRESVRVGEPDRVLGFPSFMSEYAPNTFTTGLYVGILGDFSQYWIADSLMMEFQVLSELYAATNQIGVVSRSETDAMPVLEEAFVRVKLA